MDPADVRGTVLPKNDISSFHKCVYVPPSLTACHLINCAARHVRVSIRAATGK